MMIGLGLGIGIGFSPQAAGEGGGGTPVELVQVRLGYYDIAAGELLLLVQMSAEVDRASANETKFTLGSLEANASIQTGEGYALDGGDLDAAWFAVPFNGLDPEDFPPITALGTLAIAADHGITSLEGEIAPQSMAVTTPVYFTGEVLEFGGDVLHVKFTASVDCDFSGAIPVLLRISDNWTNTQNGGSVIGTGDDYITVSVDIVDNPGAFNSFVIDHQGGSGIVPVSGYLPLDQSGTLTNNPVQVTSVTQTGGSTYLYEFDEDVTVTGNVAALEVDGGTDNAFIGPDSCVQESANSLTATYTMDTPAANWRIAAVPTNLSLPANSYVPTQTGATA